TLTALTLAGSDGDGDALTFVVVTQPTHGALTGSGASRTYTPAADYHGSDGFAFKANDGALDSAPATVSITLTAVNDAPVADAQSITTAKDTAKDIVLTGSDVDGDALTFLVVTQPGHGALTGSGASLTYTPVAGYNGSDSFTFAANDGQADSPPGTVDIAVGAQKSGCGCAAGGAAPFAWAVLLLLGSRRSSPVGRRHSRRPARRLPR
ncbi:MAG: Ig-like domain-containing protein, partial [Myxococcaceae bacterium]